MARPLVAVQGLDGASTGQARRMPRFSGSRRTLLLRWVLLKPHVLPAGGSARRLHGPHPLGRRPASVCGDEQEQAPGLCGEPPGPQAGLPPTADMSWRPGALPGGWQPPRRSRLNRGVQQRAAWGAAAAAGPGLIKSIPRRRQRRSHPALWRRAGEAARKCEMKQRGAGSRRRLRSEERACRKQRRRAGGRTGGGAGGHRQAGGVSLALRRRA